MKKIKILGTVFILFIGFTSMAQTDSVKRELIKKDLLNDYLSIKNSLIISDSVQTAKYADSLAKSIVKFRFKGLKLDEMNASTTARANIVTLATEIGKTKNINIQRKKFIALSEELWIIAGRIKPAEQPLFQQVCPMTGATWISNEKTIKNPYYPKNMLTCGEIKASL